MATTAALSAANPARLASIKPILAPSFAFHVQQDRTIVRFEFVFCLNEQPVSLIVSDFLLVPSGGSGNTGCFYCPGGWYQGSTGSTGCSPCPQVSCCMLKCQEFLPIYNRFSCPFNFSGLLLSHRFEICHCLSSRLLLPSRHSVALSMLPRVLLLALFNWVHWLCCRQVLVGLCSGI
jgi:hypothetical protein